MLPSDTDVLIVGAGPAGTSAAFELATQGVRVLILEKSGFPRYKTCGGGLTPKILAELPFDLSPVIESTIHSIKFSYRFRESYTNRSPDPLMFCTMRSNLDKFLLEKAVQAGASVLMNQHVTGITPGTSGVVVSTKATEFHAKIVIGAEGASGIVARSFNLRKHISPGLAWEAEIRTGPRFLEAYTDMVFLDWGTFPGGYGWVFPKKDHISVGVGGPAGLSGMMLPYYHKFYEYVLNSSPDILDLKPEAPHGQPLYETLSLKSWPIPVRTKKSVFHNGCVMVTGDAAGLTDPLTGEGIYYAIRSGKLAAQAGFGYLAGESHTLESYSERVNSELMTELLEANNIKHLFNAFPRKIHLFVRDSDRAWRAFGKVLRGERLYTDVKTGFGKLENFWTLVCLITGWVEKIKGLKWPGGMKKGLPR